MRVEFGTLLGKTILSIENKHNEVLCISTEDGCRYELLHLQDCCETVNIESIDGDLLDLVGSPLLMAEEVSNAVPESYDGYLTKSWTFYKMATIKGYVTIRWCGESNGYYSVDVDLLKIR